MPNRCLSISPEPKSQVPSLIKVISPSIWFSKNIALLKDCPQPFIDPSSFGGWVSLRKTPPPTHFFFQRLTEAQIEKIQKDLEQERREEEKENILCKVCQHQITSYKNKIEVNGQHQHVFSNPAGFIFEIGCFSSANGCVNQGSPTLEYTWFQGYYWRLALCSNCYTHLGWFYQSENDSFYGLILKNLEEGL